MRAALLLSLLSLTACASSPATLAPKNAVEASANRTQVLARYEFRSHCGKPCQPITIRWQADGQYTLEQGSEAAVTGQLPSDTVHRLAELYAQLKELTADLPSDLNRATVCGRFATDHAVKYFATPVGNNAWHFKDNRGCMDFEKAETLRKLEAEIESALPHESSRAR